MNDVLEALKSVEGKVEIDFTKIPNGKTISFSTLNSVYAVRKLEDGKVEAKGGKYLKDWTPVSFHGCTFGGSCLKVGFLVESMYAEFGTPKGTLTTSRIVKILIV